MSSTDIATCFYAGGRIGCVVWLRCCKTTHGHGGTRGDRLHNSGTTQQCVTKTSAYGDGRGLAAVVYDVAAERCTEILCGCCCCCCHGGGSFIRSTHTVVFEVALRLLSVSNHQGGGLRHQCYMAAVRRVLLEALYDVLCDCKCIAEKEKGGMSCTHSVDGVTGSGSAARARAMPSSSSSSSGMPTT